MKYKHSHGNCLAWAEGGPVRSRAEAEQLFREGCDAEYCPDPETCRKRHYHLSNCRCVECCELEDSVD